MTKAQQQEQTEAREKLRKWLKPGDTVYVILRHVAKSGMSRDIGVVLLHPDGSRMVDLHPNYLVAKAIGAPLNKAGDGVKMGGCGMDMGFELVYNLAFSLFGKHYQCPGKKRCQSNEHRNPGPDRDKYGRGVTHEDPGYALTHRWL